MPMMSEAEAEILRVVERGEHRKSASFEVYVAANKGWLACIAVVASWGSEITVYREHLTPAQAALMAKALSLAIEWIESEMEAQRA